MLHHVTRRACAALLGLLSWASWTWGIDIDGVQPAALDQPRINLQIRRSPDQPPLAGVASKNDLSALLDMAEAKPKKRAASFNIAAFFDTGASGVVISAATADVIGLQRLGARDAQGNLKAVIFHDVGVGGGDQFNVSEPLFLSMAPYHPQADTTDPEGDYKAKTPALRVQIGPLNGGDGLLQMVVGNLDVVGVPAMAGKVVVIDPTPVNSLGDTMRTYVYEPGTPFNPAASKRNPGIPTVSRHVKLTNVSFERFTTTTPPQAKKPTIAANPMIGPDPTAASNDNTTPPVVVAHGGKTSNGTWLLDTGAAASMISTKQAAAVGVEYLENADAVLKNIPKEKQFSLTVGGIGGGRKSAGFYLEELRITTIEGEVIVFKNAPVLVCDITVEDPTTKQKVTLDGVLGMNYFAASAKISEGLLPNLGNITEGPFDWVVFDQPAGVLGLQLRKELLGR